MSAGTKAQPPASAFASAGAAAAAAAASPARWQVQLLGRLQAQGAGGEALSRFPSRAVALLLARLALAPQRAHPREELIEALWPGVEPATGRNRLRQALSTLKSLLEPPGWPAVLQADRLTVRAVNAALASDVGEFERLCRAASGDASACSSAQALYVGELLPGFYEEWVQEERERLAALHERLTGAAPRNPGSPWTPPPARTMPTAMLPVEALPLPSYMTRLFGAEAAMGALTQQLRRCRLVTVHGAGGSGKTRLAVEVAARLQGQAAGPGSVQQAAPFLRVAFVPLVSCSNLRQVLDAAAWALRLPRAADTEALVAALLQQSSLLVLDNAEHLAGEIEPWVAELLARAPRLHLLVTSRRLLGVDGEQAFEAPSLDLPAAQTDLVAAQSNPAVALFVDRARAARSDFHLHAGVLEPVLAVVRALEGSPLAIELAASRIRSFSPAQMAQWLTTPGQGSPQLALLSRSGPRAGLDPRHASMQQVVGWSWQQLPPDQRRLLLAAARLPADAPMEAVAAAAALPPLAAADGIDALVAAAMLRLRSVGPQDAANAPQLHVDEPVRECALAQAQQMQAAQAHTAARAWMLEWVRGLGAVPAPAQVQALAPLLHGLLASAAHDGDALGASRLALSLRTYWDTDSMPVASRLALADAAAFLEGLASASPRPWLQAELSDLHELLAYCCFEAGEAEAAQQHADAALRYAGADVSRQGRAWVRLAWLQLASHRGPEAARPLLAQALQAAQSAGDLATQARVLHQQAVICTNHDGRHAEAEALLLQSEALSAGLKDQRKVLARQRNRAHVGLALGRTVEAIALLQSALAAAVAEGDKVGEMDAALTLGIAYTRHRAWADAQKALQRCIRLAWQRQHLHGLAYGLMHLPHPLLRAGQVDAALQLAGFVSEDWPRRFGPLSSADQRGLQKLQRLARRCRAPAEVQRRWREGQGLDAAQAVALALG
jgi:tetratricopeptide (TPR) repeat protein